ncbi:MAG: ribose-phosphate pyrophosphokinase-like domain-containing protein [Bdellovibrionota bacterium]
MTEIADSLGTKVAQADVRRFSDGETWVELDENIRGFSDVFCRTINEAIPPIII